MPLVLPVRSGCFDGEVGVPQPVGSVDGIPLAVRARLVVHEALDVVCGVRASPAGGGALDRDLFCTMVVLVLLVVVDAVRPLTDILEQPGLHELAECPVAPRLTRADCEDTACLLGLCLQDQRQVEQLRRVREGFDLRVVEVVHADLGPEAGVQAAHRVTPLWHNNRMITLTLELSSDTTFAELKRWVEAVEATGEADPDSKIVKDDPQYDLERVALEVEVTTPKPGKKYEL